MADIIVSAQGNLFFVALELLLGAAGAWFACYLAPRLGFVDEPSGRSSHVFPTPKGGGIGLLGAFMWGCFVFELNLLFCLSVTCLSLLSLVGDRIHLSPSVRLIVQFLAAFIIVFSLPDSSFFIGWEIVAFEYSLILLFCGGILAAVYIVGTANFYNFMDGINGIAAITGVVGFGLLAGYGVCYGKNYRYVMLCAGLALACLGFLPFNVPRAKVFMGDVGSILLGFVFAVIVVVFSETFSEFIVLSCFLFPFYADELITMVERIRGRQSLTKPHRRHLYQILANEGGIAHWQVSLGYGVFQLIAGVSVWQVSRFGLAAVLLLVMLFACLFVVANDWAKKKVSLQRIGNTVV